MRHSARGGWHPRQLLGMGKIKINKRNQKQLSAAVAGHALHNFFMGLTDYYKNESSPGNPHSNTHATLQDSGVWHR